MKYDNDDSYGDDDKKESEDTNNRRRRGIYNQYRKQATYLAPATPNTQPSKTNDPELS